MGLNQVRFPGWFSAEKLIQLRVLVIQALLPLVQLRLISLLHLGNCRTWRVAGQLQSSVGSGSLPSVDFLGQGS